MQTSNIVVPVCNHNDVEYDDLLTRLQARFLTNTQHGSFSVFKTNADDLFEVYLQAFVSPEQRQYHTCNACRRFIEKYGNLVTIDEDSKIKSAIWDVADASGAYHSAFERMIDIINKAKITRVFLPSDPTWGTPTTGEWTHFSIKPPETMIFRNGVLSAGQKMAQKREDFKTVWNALHEFSLPILEQVVALLESEHLYRSEKVLGPAKWLRDLQKQISNHRYQNAGNLVWRAVALAPEGFCHPRSSMIGTLLDDVSTGMDFDQVARRFAQKMRPTQYQRPQTPPSEGAIARAETIVDKLDAEGALARRFASVSEIEKIWSPKLSDPKYQECEVNVGVFGHLKTKKQLSNDRIRVPIPPKVMTWNKFYNTVLPQAEEILFYARAQRDSYVALVTAVNPEAPPILQWDREAHRNPVSWYLWANGSTPEEFGLESERYHPVSAITLKPSMWNESVSMEHQGQGVIFIIDGAKDTKEPGLALFPEILKSEFREIRSVIEAYSRDGAIVEIDEPPACGILLSYGGNWEAIFRVKTNDQVMDYKLDRWD